MNVVHTDGRGFELVGTAAEVREMDRRTIEELGVPGRVLMELAGAGAAEVIAARLGGGRGGEAVVLCGRGNNGGDGYVIARHLADRGMAVRCVATAAVEELSGDARANADLWVALGGEVRVATRGATAAMRGWIGGANVVVDALFGTGLSRDVSGPAAELITMANEARHGLKLAVDVPSGVDATSGHAYAPAFRADVTATFGLAKTGLLTAPGAELAGELVIVGIGLPGSIVAGVGASCRRATPAAIGALVPPRPSSGHKGSFGHVGVIGGFPGTDGAGQLAARAALRAGAGLATWCTPGEAPPRQPEIMHHDLRAGLPERPTILVVGPGLGLDDAGAAALDRALADGRPLVLDADALNGLSARGLASKARGHVVTPHPAEAGRLLGTSAREVEADRLGAAAALVELTGAVVVLKGARTIVAAPGEPAILFERPAPALAAGGTGDVLAGAIGGLMAQGLGGRDAAALAVWCHAEAGRATGLDRADRGVFASEVADALPAALAHLASGWT